MDCLAWDKQSNQWCYQQPLCHANLKKLAIISLKQGEATAANISIECSVSLMLKQSGKKKKKREEGLSLKHTTKNE